MSFDRILFGLHNRAAHGVHWRPQHVAYSAPSVPPMHVGRVHTVGQGSSPPGGVVPPAPAADFNPSPAPGATSSRLPLVLLGLGLAGAVVYIYMHQREDQARFAELERELDHDAGHGEHHCSCGRESAAANVYERMGYRPA